MGPLPLIPNGAWNGDVYDATVVLDDDGGKYVRFKLEFDNKTNGKKGN